MCVCMYMCVCLRVFVCVLASVYGESFVKIKKILENFIRYEKNLMRKIYPLYAVSAITFLRNQ